MSIFTTSNNIIFGLHLPFFVPSFVLTGALVALLNITKPPKKLSLVYQDIVENRGKKKFQYYRVMKVNLDLNKVEYKSTKVIKENARLAN